MKPLVPVHIWACPGDWKEVAGEARPDRCDEHGMLYADMGWRVGEAAANYAWYSTLERAMTDRRTK
jgi:hypothetical protein